MTSLKRMSWAGIELITGRTRILIDPLEHVEPLAAFQGKPRDPILHIEESGLTHALITHRHPDHFDPVTLRRLLGRSGAVFCPLAIAEEVQSKGLRSQGVESWERNTLDGVTFTAVPAMDWRGDEQVSWVVENDGCRIFHGGDTLWHGHWWRIAREFGPFNWAFLPINGVVAIYPGLEPSGLPATLTPKQACVAARILHAAKLCPIHYRTFNNPPAYSEQPDLLNALAQASSEEQVEVALAEPGDVLQ